MVELVQMVEVRTGGTPVRELDYTYDALNRLTGETVIGAEAATYTYDSVGNRLAKDVCSGDPLVCETTTYAYNANNQLLTEDGPDSDTAYFYDTNGSLVEKDVDDGTGMEVTTYAYDSRNRMIGAETPDDDLGFVYDADGIRVAKTVNGDVTSFLIDKVQPYAQVVEERDGAGSLVAAYTYGNDLVSQQRGSSTAYYAYDGLGSTRALTDAAGAVTDSYTYDAFGTTVSESGSTENAYRFTGEQWDAETGLEYLRARYYDPAVGRFGVMDECVSCNDRRPITANKYLYANGNPVLYIDHNGKFASLPSLMVSIAVLGILSTVALPSYGDLGSSLQGIPWNDIVTFSELKAAYPPAFDFCEPPSGGVNNCSIKMSAALREVGLYWTIDDGPWGYGSEDNKKQSRYFRNDVGPECQGLARAPQDLAVWMDGISKNTYKYENANGEVTKRQMNKNHRFHQGIYVLFNFGDYSIGHIDIKEVGEKISSSNVKKMWFFYMNP